MGARRDEVMENETLLVIRMVRMLSVQLCSLTGLWDPEAFWSLLCYGHCSDDGRRAQCLLPRLP